MATLEASLLVTHNQENTNKHSSEARIAREGITGTGPHEIYFEFSYVHQERYHIQISLRDGDAQEQAPLKQAARSPPADLHLQPSQPRRRFFYRALTLRL